MSTNAGISPDDTSGSELNFHSWLRSWTRGWDQFWFRPEDPATLALIRVLTGCVVFYAHLAWSSELLTFFGNAGVLPADYRQLLFGNGWAWSHFDLLQSATTIWCVHGIGLVIIALFTCGIWSRVTAVLTAALVVSYANRATGALFGLDQIMGFLCLYLAIGNSGGAYSVDRWLSKRRNRKQETGNAGVERAGQGGWFGTNGNSR